MLNKRREKGSPYQTSREQQKKPSRDPLYKTEILADWKIFQIHQIESFIETETPKDFNDEIPIHGVKRQSTYKKIIMFSKL